MNRAGPDVLTQTPRNSLDIGRVRAEFPGLHQDVHGVPLVYLDNAATAQKPRAVIEAVSTFYATDYANVHRGVHTLSERATDAFENGRETVRRFINAREAREIVFVRGTTEAINLVATSFGGSTLRGGDEVLITEMEHHANIVPWQRICEETGARLRVAPVTDAGELQIEALDSLLGARTRIVALTHVSNALGTVNPVARVVKLAHAVGAKVLVDGAQSVPHMSVDVQTLDCDFYAFSGHKLYGPTGIGVLYGKAELLAAMPPYQTGGEMIRQVTFEQTTYAEPPYKFEAGTPDIAGVIGLAAAIDYLTELGMARVEQHESALMQYAREALGSIAGLRVVGTPVHQVGAVSFVLDGIHPHDIGTILDRHGVAVRVGHHCAMPLMRRFELPATARASFAIYNHEAEIDALTAAIAKVKEVFGDV